ncbi:hypothetical protein ACP70R_028489 [Stipagrostis hirtigluma subsp. patula]
MSLQRQPQDRDGMIASWLKGEDPPCQRDDDSQGGEIEIYSGPSLPEEFLNLPSMMSTCQDIWHHIYSLVPMRDAARVACVSRAFLRSWRCHPNLTFTEETFRSNKDACGEDETARDLCSKFDHILKRHSGIGVKTLNINMFIGRNAKQSCYLNRWLEIAVIPGIEELCVSVPMMTKHEFPYSLLSNGSGDSIRSLVLNGCSFHPTSELGLLRRLTRLHLRSVRITGDELGILLSNSLALERLEVIACDKLVCLKVPPRLHRLSYLNVDGCGMLKLIDSEASNLSCFVFAGDRRVKLSLGETLRMKNLDLFSRNMVCYARVHIPLSMPNLETLTIYSRMEVANTPMLPSKFLRLKYLFIALNGRSFSPNYDYFSLVSFLDACPSLEVLVLDVKQRGIEHVSIFEDPSDMRQMREQRHHNLKSMRIVGFSSTKSLVELTCHVVESTTSLECLVLQAYHSPFMCSEPHNKSGKCSSLPMEVLAEARRGILAIKTYIEPKVPPTVKLHVVELCSCHAIEL